MIMIAGSRFFSGRSAYDEVRNAHFPKIRIVAFVIRQQSRKNHCRVMLFLSSRSVHADRHVRAGSISAWKRFPVCRRGTLFTAFPHGVGTRGFCRLSAIRLCTVAGHGSLFCPCGDSSVFFAYRLHLRHSPDGRFSLSFILGMRPFARHTPLPGSAFGIALRDVLILICVLFCSRGKHISAFYAACDRIASSADPTRLCTSLCVFASAFACLLSARRVRPSCLLASVVRL